MKKLLTALLLYPFLAYGSGVVSWLDGVSGVDPNDIGTGGITLANTACLNIKDAGGTAIGVVCLNASDILTIGDATGVDGITISTAATTGNSVDIGASAVTTGNVFDISDADGLTTGRVINAVSNSSDAGTRRIGNFHNDHASATGTTVLYATQDSNAIGFQVWKTAAGAGSAADIENDGTGATIRANTDGNGISIDIDSEATTADTVFIDSNQTTTGDAFQVAASGLTTGRAGYFYSNSADTGVRNVFEIVSDNTLAVNATVLKLQQDAATVGLSVDHNANHRAVFVDAENTTAESVYILSDVLTTGTAFYVDSDSADTGTRNVAFMINTNTAAVNATVLHLEQNAALQVMILNQDAIAPFIDYQGTSAASAAGPITTWTTGNAVQGHFEIEINGVSRWVRFYDDPTS
jgi:hypothetical protein